MTDRPSASPSRQTLADFVTLALTAPLVFLAKPDLSYLSMVSRGGELGGDTLGAAARSMAVLLWLGVLGAAVLGSQPAAPTASEGRTGGWLQTVLRWTLVACLGLVFFVLPSLSDQGALAAFGPGGSPALQLRVQAHDGGVLQTQAATEALVAGQNPYAINYAATPMAASHHSRPQLWRALGFEANPAFEFYPYPPLTFLLPLPFRGFALATGRGWDPRVFHVLAWLALGWCCARAPRDRTLAAPLVALIALSPVAAAPFVSGYNDISCVAALVGALALAHRDHPRAAFVVLALACGLKQFAWLALPLYLVHRVARQLAPECSDAPGSGSTSRRLLAELGPGAVVLVLTFLPFLAWDPERLWFCLVRAQGSLYPVRATGLGMANLWVAWGLVESPRDPTPNLLLYAVVVMPVMALGAWHLYQRPSLWRMAGTWAVVIGTFCFVSRHFAPSYTWVLVALLGTTAFLALDRRPATASGATSPRVGPDPKSDPPAVARRKQAQGHEPGTLDTL